MIGRRVYRNWKQNKSASGLNMLADNKAGLFQKLFQQTVLTNCFNELF
ncbi:MAG: hypothetical protein ACI86X_002251 [Moritella sp.]|jgi:hypothetical protein